MRKVKTLLIIVGIMYSFFLCRRNDPSSLSSLALQNIEALAEGEEGDGYFCYGTGDVKCPDGKNVKYVMDNYNLK